MGERERAFVAALATVFACGAPSSFDGLVSGAAGDAGADGPKIDPRPEPGLAPPRPIAPLSLSWIDASRPHLRWEHVVTGAIGARIEMCRTPRCDGEKKVFDAGGTEIEIGEDLSPGVWFWRLATRTADTLGTPTSPVWELLVRGGAGGDPKKKGLPSGSIVDLDGDGRADLLATAEIETSPGVTEIEIVPLLAMNADSTEFQAGQDVAAGLTTKAADPRLAVNDATGDGVADVVFTDALASPTSPKETTLTLLTGARATPFAFDPSRLTTIATPRLEGAPALHEAGDVDGDGYGDVVVSTKLVAMALFGTVRGPGPFEYLMQLEPNPAPDSGAPAPLTEAPPVHGGFDRNADGLADLMVSAAEPKLPFFFFPGIPTRRLDHVEPKLTDDGVVTPATAFATGDLDGDGLGDVAFVTTVGDKPSVCVLLGKERIEAAHLVCWTPEPSPPAGFGSALIAVDVDADGKDEIVVGTTGGGIDVLSFPAESLVAQHVPTEYGAGLTAILPGRPGPATWAATRTDGTSIAVFRGKAQAGTIAPRPPWKRFGKALR